MFENEMAACKGFSRVEVLRFLIKQSYGYINGFTSLTLK